MNHPSEPPSPAERESAADLVNGELDRLIDLYRELRSGGDASAVRGSLVTYMLQQGYDFPVTATLFAAALERLTD
ncbi:hypothetical protein ACPZ19_18915 [Amycolatopsis lurida]